MTWRAAVPLLMTTVFVALLIFAVGYSIGNHRSTTHMATGYAYASPLQIGASSAGWSYDIPLDVSWRDGAGGWHDGSRPACLKASTHRIPVTFAWVPADAGDVNWRTVVWVDCG